MTLSKTDILHSACFTGGALTAGRTRGLARMWEESDGDMKSVVKDIPVEKGEVQVCFGDCQALLWLLELAIFQRGSKVLIF